MNGLTIETSLFDKNMLDTSMFDRDKYDEASLKCATNLNKPVSNQRNRFVSSLFQKIMLVRLIIGKS